MQISIKCPRPKQGSAADVTYDIMSLFRFQFRWRWDNVDNFLSIFSVWYGIQYILHLEWLVGAVLYNNG